MIDSPVISCRQVWKLFGDKPEAYLAQMPQGHTYEQILADGYIAGVNNVSVDVLRGDILVVMGLSGSGKSTLLRCMARLHTLTGGTVEVDGEDITHLGEKELIELRRSKMGMVFQGFGLLPHRTVLQNVAFPLEMRGQSKHDCRTRALEMVRLVGLEGREDYFPRELSGGQQQRVGIARSLAIEPDIWFLDEPFSALDPLIRREMQDEFMRLQAMLNKTIIFVTHDFNEALRLADRIAIMKNGVVEQCDTPDRIVLAPATEYVAKFTEEVEKSRVVHVETLIDASLVPDGTSAGAPVNAPVNAKSTIHAIARRVFEQEAPNIPVESGGKIIGMIRRSAALDLLLGDGE